MDRAIREVMTVDPLDEDRKELERKYPYSSSLVLNATQRDIVGEMIVAIMEDCTIPGDPFAVRVYRGDILTPGRWVLVFTAATCATLEDAERHFTTTRATLTGVMKMPR